MLTSPRSYLRAGLAGLFLCLLASMTNFAAQASEPAEAPAARDARMAWWREAKFGLFIHWGVYAVPAGTYKGERISGIGEWIMLRGRIPVAEYRAFAREFNPVRYDPGAWAKLAREAGMKYVVITAKHHDGFALYPSDVTDWDVADASPYGRDLITPLAEATRREGLKFGTYYSQAQDWTHPGGAKSRMEEGAGWDEAHRGSFDDYLRTIAIPQTREILTRIKPDILWWDTPTWMNAERARPLHDLIALRPGLITNNRLGGGYRGDTETPEQHIPATGFKDRDWETCMTMNDTWGFKSYDDNWKSTKTLVHQLVDVVSKGGNYLLNVGPTAAGEIPAESVERLREIGRWMKVNGEAIYGTAASPFAKLPWGRCTQKTKDGVTTLYLHVFDWPADGRLPVPGLKSKVTRATVLATGKPARVVRDGAYLALQVPPEAPDAHASVLKLVLQGPLAVDSLLPRPGADGVVRLDPKMADLHGNLGAVVALAGPPHNPHIAHPAANSWVGWAFETAAPGAYEVVAELAAAKPGSRYAIACGTSKLEAEIPATGGAETFTTVSLGRVEIAQAGPAELALRPVRDAWNGVNLRSVLLRPVQAAAPRPAP